MHGIEINAALMTAIAIVVFGTFIRKMPHPVDPICLWMAALVTLPMQPLAYYCVRVPLDHACVLLLGSSSTAYQLLTSLYAPLTEEPAKLVALAIPIVRRDIQPTNFLRYSIAIGVAFAIGEMWFIAHLISKQPQYTVLPAWEFLGYSIERLLTCVFHSEFVALSLWQLRSRFILGFSLAMGAHWLSNFPILLMAWNVGGIGREAWSVIVQLWILTLFIISLAMFSFVQYGRVSPARLLFGRRTCPECMAVYDAPLFAFNFVFTRYERCPNCQHWHWTSRDRSESV